MDLSESDVSDIGLTALAVPCKRLQKIDLNAVKGTRTNITYQGLCSYHISINSCTNRIMHMRTRGGWDTFISH